MVKTPTSMVTSLLVLLSVVAISHCVSECRSDQDCHHTECCVFATGKFGGTSCGSRGRQYDQCRPKDTAPHNVTVSDPGSSPVSTSAHYQLCPCLPGLVCDPDLGFCKRGLPPGSESHPAQHH